MIVYLDSSVLARVYLPDEDGHDEAAALLTDQDAVTVTGTWTRIEVSGALVRAARARRGMVGDLLAVLDGDLGPDGPVTVLAAPQAEVEEHALRIVRSYGLRSMDAWHLATAALTTATLAERDEPITFASRDAEQAAVAKQLGFVRWPGSS